MNKQFFYIFGVLLLISMISTTGYFYTQVQKNHRELSALKTTPQPTPPTGNVQIVNAVSKLIELPPVQPDDIIPIKDKSLLKDQPFFDQAKNDDVLLVYRTIKKAVLYRPSTNKIVDVTTINISSAAPGQVSGAVTGAGTGIVPP